MQNIFTATKDCPNCRANAEITAYGHVNEIENPGVGALIGSYRAHMRHCPKCGVPILYRYTTIYEDVGNNVVFAFTREKEYNRFKIGTDCSTKKYSTPLVCCIFLLFRRCDGT